MSSRAQVKRLFLPRQITLAADYHAYTVVLTKESTAYSLVANGYDNSAGPSVQTYIMMARNSPVDGSFLPPRDRPGRVSVTSVIGIDQKAVFENFILYH